jgi:hypothetical protein
MKLSHQFKGGGTGGPRISGAGSTDWDEKSKALISKEVKERAKVSVEDMLAGKGQSKLHWGLSQKRQSGYLLLSSFHGFRGEINGSEGKGR